MTQYSALASRSKDLQCCTHIVDRAGDRVVGVPSFIASSYIPSVLRCLALCLHVFFPCSFETSWISSQPVLNMLLGSFRSNSYLSFHWTDHSSLPLEQAPLTKDWGNLPSTSVQRRCNCPHSWWRTWFGLKVGCGPPQVMIPMNPLVGK